MEQLDKPMRRVGGELPAIGPATTADFAPLIKRFGQWWYFHSCLRKQARGDGALFVARGYDGGPLGHGFLRLEEAEEPEISAGLPGIPLITHLQVAEAGQGVGSVPT